MAHRHSHIYTNTDLHTCNMQTHTHTYLGSNVCTTPLKPRGGGIASVMICYPGGCLGKQQMCTCNVFFEKGTMPVQPEFMQVDARLPPGANLGNGIGSSALGCKRRHLASTWHSACSRHNIMCIQGFEWVCLAFLYVMCLHVCFSIIVCVCADVCVCVCLCCCVLSYS